MAFIIKRLQYLTNNNKRLFGIRSGFRGLSSRNKKDDQKGCFNCHKSDHFIAGCPDLWKESFQKNNFISKFKKSFMAKWDELDDEEEAYKSKEEYNLALVDPTFSDS